MFVTSSLPALLLNVEWKVLVLGTSQLRLLAGRYRETTPIVDTHLHHCPKWRPEESTAPLL